MAILALRPLPATQELSSGARRMIFWNENQIKKALSTCLLERMIYIFNGELGSSEFIEVQVKYSLHNYF